MRDSTRKLPSGRFESHWYINDFLGTISPNPAITAKLPGDHHRPTSPPKTPGRSPPPPQIHPKLPHPRPIRADADPYREFAGMGIRFSPDACPPHPSGGCMISTDGSAFSRICAGLLATCAIQAIISHRADSSRIGISTIPLAQYRRTRPSQPNSREITTTPRVRPKLPGDLHRPHKSTQNSRVLAPSAPTEQNRARRAGRYPHDGRDFKRVRCRPNGCTKEIRLPANQASAGPTSCRIRWSAALRTRHQHRAG